MKIRKKVRRLVDDCAQTDTKNIDDKEIQTEVLLAANNLISRKTTFQTQNTKPAQVERSGVTQNPLDDSSVEQIE